VLHTLLLLLTVAAIIPRLQHLHRILEPLPRPKLRRSRRQTLALLTGLWIPYQPRGAVLHITLKTPF
jgi:hypothetical protein